MRKRSVISSRPCGAPSGHPEGLLGRSTLPELAFTRLFFAATPDLLAASSFVVSGGCHTVSPEVAACVGNRPHRRQKWESAHCSG
jgi:hypothetical protein